MIESRRADSARRRAISTPPGGTAATDQRAFTFLPIETGRDAGDRVVVKSGLKEGDVVVASGAYLLKSELILQNQTEEE